jgi:anti-sigma regulatory factor (Ser/Thr protein kinase)
MNVTTPQLRTPLHCFAQRLSSTRRGARLARLLTHERLCAWEVSSTVVERAGQIVAELAANAALHGHVQGRDFRLALTLGQPAAGVLRIAVTDARGDRLPATVTDFVTPSDSETGRGLLIVSALADRWGTEPYQPAGKTVWAELDVDPGPGTEKQPSAPSGGRVDTHGL